MAFQAFHQVPLTHSSESSVFPRILFAIVKQYPPYFTAVSPIAFSSRFQYSAIICSSVIFSVNIYTCLGHYTCNNLLIFSFYFRNSYLYRQPYFSNLTKKERALVRARSKPLQILFSCNNCFCFFHDICSCKAIFFHQLIRQTGFPEFVFHCNTSHWSRALFC